jgi:UDP-galactopyranose mutase
MGTKKVVIIGAGFSGAVLARTLAESGKYSIDLFDEREHVAGNCHMERDKSTGIFIHCYGPHIFNTSNSEVWSYVNRFSTFMPFINRVKAVTARGVFSLPINLLTINQFFKKTLNPVEAEKFISSLGDSSIANPVSFEEQALKFVGRELYENFFYGYTKKQWGVNPRDLPASILKRLPVRFNYDDNYYSQTYQGIPLEGYTVLIQKILDHANINVTLRTSLNANDLSEYDHCFYSGPLDRYFGYAEGRLEYRTLDFVKELHKGDYQGNAVINYCEETVPFTRITEHKHFAPWETHEKTVIFKEFSRLCELNDVPYYPLRLTKDKEILKRYVRLADEQKKTTFIGRLGTYRYLDMHVVIAESLDLGRRILSEGIESAGTFSVRPI